MAFFYSLCFLFLLGVAAGADNIDHVQIAVKSAQAASCEVTIYEHSHTSVNSDYTGDTEKFLGPGKHPVQGLFGASSVEVKGQGCMAYGYTSADCSGEKSGTGVSSTTQVAGRAAGIVSSSDELVKYWGCNDCIRCVQVEQGDATPVPTAATPAPTAATPAPTAVVIKEVDWGIYFDSKGEKTEGVNGAITGLKRSESSNGEECKLNCIEKIKVAQFEQEDCYWENWGTSFDDIGESICKKSGFFVAGFKKDGDDLKELDKAFCCKRKGLSDYASECVAWTDWSTKFDTEGWVECPEGSAIAGLSRSDKECKTLKCIEKAKCCRYE